MVKQFRKEFTFGNKILVLETGLLANQADGAVLATYGKTSVLCTVVSAKQDAEDVDFFPLTVNYIEKQYAGGKIPGGFFKREGRQSEKEILISRLIDRPLRAIFADGYFRNTQVVCTLLSYDKINEPDIPAIIGASAAIAIAGLPTTTVLAACRVGYLNKEYICNPSQEDCIKGELDLVVAGSDTAILMVESQAKQLSEEIMLGAILFAQESYKPVIHAIKELTLEVNKEKVINFIPRDRSNLYKTLSKDFKQQVIEAYAIVDKLKRHNAISDIYKTIIERFTPIINSESEEALVKVNKEKVKLNAVDLKLTFEKLQEEVVRGKIMEDKKRIDGRALDQIRQIDVRTDILPIVHGSALFTRGGTQVMSVTTLGGTLDEQMQDSLTDLISSERFILHYNFYGYSAGEASAPRAPGRREIGHGKLAHRALYAVMPTKEEFPYTVRVVNEVLSSDGSTSMATVCGTSMSLMATGVPIKSPVAGIAMGLIKEDEEYAILTDIMADEDHLGDMDFKVAGTQSGITALQMDIKTDGITNQIMQHALEKAKKARLTILEKMLATLPAARDVVSENAPKVFNLVIKESQIPELIGKGGSSIKNICEKSGAKVEISPTGSVAIFASSDESMTMAKNMISAIIDDVEYGEIFEGKIKSIMPFGMIVDIGYDRTGLVHISEISHNRIDNIHDHYVEGGIVKVKCIGTDEKGRTKFSVKSVDQETGLDIGQKKDNCKQAVIPNAIELTEERPPRNNQRSFQRRSNDRGDRHDKRRDDGRNDKRPKNRKPKNDIDYSEFKKKKKKRFFFF
jgi:polyribonucleotide nucleotidyltransferase